MGNRDTSTVRTGKRRLAGHVSTGPTGVLAQSRAAMSRPASPPAPNRSPVSGPEGESGATFTSSREGRSPRARTSRPVGSLPGFDDPLRATYPALLGADGTAVR